MAKINKEIYMVISWSLKEDKYIRQTQAEFKGL